MFFRRAGILWLAVRRLDLILNYLKGEAARSCRDSYTYFRQFPFHALGLPPQPRTVPASQKPFTTQEHNDMDAVGGVNRSLSGFASSRTRRVALGGGRTRRSRAR